MALHSVALNLAKLRAVVELVDVHARVELRRARVVRHLHVPERGVPAALVRGALQLAELRAAVIGTPSCWPPAAHPLCGLEADVLRPEELQSPSSL